MKIILATLTFLFVLTISHAQENGYKVFKTDSRIIYDICFAKKGSVLSVADDNKVKVFSTASQALLYEFSNGHKATILTIDLAEDSTLLVSGGKDSTLVVWDFVNRKILKSLRHHKGLITSARISPDAKWLASGGTDDRVYLYDLLTNQVIHQFADHSDDVTSVEFSYDGSLLATASGDGTIKIYELKNFTLSATLQGHRSWVRDLSFTRDGKTLISCGDDSRVIKWQILNPGNIRMLETNRIGFGWLLSVDAHSDNTTYATAGVNGMAEIVSTFGKYIKKIRLPITRILLKPNEGAFLKVAVATRGKGVFLMDAKDMK